MGPSPALSLFSPPLEQRAGSAPTQRPGNPWLPQFRGRRSAGQPQRGDVAPDVSSSGGDGGQFSPPSSPGVAAAGSPWSPGSNTGEGSPKEGIENHFVGSPLASSLKLRPQSALQRWEDFTSPGTSWSESSSLPVRPASSPPVRTPPSRPFAMSGESTVGERMATERKPAERLPLDLDARARVDMDNGLRREVQQLRSNLNATVADLMEAKAELALLRPDGSDSLRRAKEFLAMQGVASTAASADMSFRYVPLCAAKELICSKPQVTQQARAGASAKASIQSATEQFVEKMKRRENLLEAQLEQMQVKLDQLRAQHQHFVEMARHVSALCWRRQSGVSAQESAFLWGSIEKLLRICNLAPEDENFQDEQSGQQPARDPSEHIVDPFEDEEDDEIELDRQRGVGGEDEGKRRSQERRRSSSQADSASNRPSRISFSQAESALRICKSVSPEYRQARKSARQSTLKLSRIGQSRVRHLWHLAAGVVERFNAMKCDTLTPIRKFAAVLLHDTCQRLSGDVEAGKMECPSCRRSWWRPYPEDGLCPYCRTFLTDVEVQTGRLGIYEFVAQCVRSWEFAARTCLLRQLMPTEVRPKKPKPKSRSPAQTEKAKSRLQQTSSIQPEDSTSTTGVPLEQQAVQRTCIESCMYEQYNQAFEEAGGQLIADLCSSQVSNLLRRLRETRRVGQVCQDVGYSTLGLDRLVEMCSCRRQKLTTEVQRIADKTYGISYVPGLKDRVRARSKILTMYNDDTACLTDILRASISYGGLEELYSGLQVILEEDLEYRRNDFFIREVEDRVQKTEDGYRDIMVLFDIDGVICEVQLNCRSFVEAQKSDEHKTYKRGQHANELVFEACIRNYEEELVALACGHQSCASGVRDKHSRTALHYACQHGSAVAVRYLMKFAADPWAEDGAGILPCELALRAKHFDALFLVLAQMYDIKPTDVRMLRRLAEHSLTWWCDHTAFTKVDMMSSESKESLRDELVSSSPLDIANAFGSDWKSAGCLMRRVLRQHALLGGEGILDKWLSAAAYAGQTNRVLALLSTGFDVKAQHGRSSAMDCAIEGGHSELAETLHVIRTRDARECCTCWMRHVNEHLQEAAKDEDGPRALAALCARADPNDIKAKASGRRTALMAFAAAGDLVVVQQLVKCQAQVGYQDAFGNYALHYAKVFGHVHVKEYVESVKSLPDLPMHKLLQMSKWGGVHDYMIEAVRAGCCAASWRAAADEATLATFQETIKARLGPHRYTLLHFAVQAVRENDPAGQVCRSLLLLRADGTAKGKYGESPLHLLAYEGSRSLYDQMLNATQVLASIGRRGLDEKDCDSMPGQDPQELLCKKMTQKESQVRARHPTERGVQEEAAGDGRLLLEVGWLGLRHNLLASRVQAWRKESSKTRRERPGKSHTKFLSVLAGRALDGEESMMSAEDSSAESVAGASEDGKELPMVAAESDPIYAAERKVRVMAASAAESDGIDFGHSASMPSSSRIEKRARRTAGSETSASSPTPQTGKRWNKVSASTRLLNTMKRDKGPGKSTRQPVQASKADAANGDDTNGPQHSQRTAMIKRTESRRFN